ncbi:Rab-type small G protein [Oopsacas minuta]|uniref:Rab-type small G protein n=1 Tax=Oopsacas minuta TaxID=111878 RepID=A0AAV7K226_9METZ|nr:Rab-type small G protein [Oopsacas minuta]
MCYLHFDICGKKGAGKSSLLSRFVNNSFDELCCETNGIHMGVKKVSVDGRYINLYIWDSYLYSKVDSYPISNFKSVDGFVFVFDCTDERAIEDILEWQKKVEQEGQTHIPKLLLSNKCDMECDRVISRLSAVRLAEKYKMEFFEVSAKNSSQVELAFLTLTALLLS